MNVMKNAWEIARDGVKNFGGNAKEYFAESLKISWSLLKNESGYIGKKNTIRKEWTTSRGAKVVMEYTTERDESFTNEWGQKVKMVKQGIFPTYLSINGEEVSTWNTTRTPGKHELNLGRVRFKGKESVIRIEMPEDVSIEVYGELPTKKVKKHPLLCPECGDFCHGECAI